MLHRLLIMRHAKSSWDNPLLDDMQRPLNARGLNDAPMMGRRIAALGYQWDHIIASPAKRAMTTAKLVADAIKYEHPLSLDERLYFLGVDAIIDIISHIEESVTSLMLFGHNPDMHLLYEQLSKRECHKFSTAAYALFESDAPWQEYTALRFINFDKPKSQQ